MSVLFIGALALSVLYCKHPLCMPHDLTTANRHDHTKTENWAQNICTSEHANVPMELRYEGRQHERRDCLYTTKVKWKIYQTSCALLDVGFVFLLRRTDIFHSNMSMYGRLAELNNCHFSNYPSSQTKLLRSFCFSCHVVLEWCYMMSLNAVC